MTKKQTEKTDKKDKTKTKDKDKKTNKKTGKKVTLDTIKKDIKPVPKQSKSESKKEKENKKPKVKFTRDKAVVMAINRLGKLKKGFTFPELLKSSDKIMVDKGFSSNPTATNINGYLLQGLLAFNVVKQDKPGRVSMKNGIRYTLA